jgi:DNA-binding MarR family transcriptional regulator
MPPKSSRRPSSRPPAPTAPALPLDAHVGYLLRCAWQRSAAHLGAVIEPLTPTQYAVLSRLLEHGELSQNRLGRLTAMERGNISELVARLSDAGLLATRGDPNDRRLLLVSLTRDGRRTAERAIAASLDAHERLLTPLDAAERRTLIALLRKIIDAEPT